MFSRFLRFIIFRSDNDSILLCHLLHIAIDAQQEFQSGAFPLPRLLFIIRFCNQVTMAAFGSPKGMSRLIRGFTAPLFRMAFS